MLKRALKLLLKDHPQAKAVVDALRGHQLLALEYPVDMRPRWNEAPHALLERRIAEQREAYRERLEGFLAYRHKLSSLRGVTWVNGFLPAIDSISLYCLLAQSSAKRYVEIGSGNSTLFARASIRDNGLRTRITSIDPSPRRDIRSSADEVLQRPAEDVPVSVFGDLEAGDILFVDNSHRCFPNSDVTAFFLDILPAVQPGVLVHLHDICLPWDYPADVAKLAYSEQYLLGTALLFGDRINTVLPNKFVEKTPELLSVLSPIFDDLGEVERQGCSYWFTVRP